MESVTGKVSVIMAAYNAEKTIRFAIESVLAQTYNNYELLVVNDGSVDATKEIVEAYCKEDSRVKLINNSKNMGVSLTRQNGLKHATGEWVAILDSDDIWTPDKLQKQMLLQKKTQAALLYTGSGFINQAGYPIDWTLQVPEFITYRKLLKQNIISNSSALCRKDLFEHYYVIGDDTHEDFALWLRILKNGEVAYGVNEPLLIYRLSSGSKTANKARAAVMNWRTYRMVGLSIFEAAYYQFLYMLKSIVKYLEIKCH